jgi:hypothetical protein
MRSFIDGNGGSGSNGLIQEELGATVSPNATHTSAPATMGSEETSRQESTILERQLNGKEQEIIKVKLEMLEEIQRLKLGTRWNGNSAEGKRRTNTPLQAAE